MGGIKSSVEGGSCQWELVFQYGVSDLKLLIAKVGSHSAKNHYIVLI